MSALARYSTRASTALARPALLPRSYTRAFSQSKPAYGGGASHEDRYDPPTGWLWGVKPGEKPKKEGWENVWYYGYFGSFAFAAIAYSFKPDTSIQTWALEEARRRLEAEGILPDPDDVKSDEQ